MGKLNNPLYSAGVQEKYIYLNSPDTQAEIDGLKSELEREKSKPILKEVVEVERVVEKTVLRDDPALLKRYNEAMSELGKLRKAQPLQQTNTVEVVKTIQTVKLNKKLAYIVSVISFGVGFLACFISFVK